VGRLFAIPGELVDLRPLGHGHIHHTVVASYRSAGGGVHRYVHQRLNTTVFPDLATLMGNVARVTSHLATRVDDPRRSVRLRTAAGGRPYAFDAAGAPWRTLELVEGARTAHRFDGPAQAADGAATAARLVADLADLHPPLPEVIPDFHDVPRRLCGLERAREDDTHARARTCTAEVDAVLAHTRVALDVDDARADGRLPERTVHNDAKVANLLFDAGTDAALCLVDLDTVGPGTVLFDVGDLVRSGAVAGGEDGDPGSVRIDHDIVGAVLESYASAGSGFLSRSEADLLASAGPLMALEAAARFLTDHLRGDVYFRVDGPGHNLRRARNQIRVLELLLAG